MKFRVRVVEEDPIDPMIVLAVILTAVTTTLLLVGVWWLAGWRC